MKRILMASTAILLAVAAWKTMSSSATPKATMPRATKPEQPESHSVGILVLASIGNKEKMESKIGRQMELSSGAVITDPVQGKDGMWGLIIATEKPVRLGGCMCIFDQKPNVQTGQIVKVLGTYAGATDQDYDGRKVRMLRFEGCELR